MTQPYIAHHGIRIRPDHCRDRAPGTPIAITAEEGCARPSARIARSRTIRRRACFRFDIETHCTALLYAAGRKPRRTADTAFNRAIQPPMPRQPSSTAVFTRGSAAYSLMRCRKRLYVRTDIGRQPTRRPLIYPVPVYLAGEVSPPVDLLQARRPGTGQGISVN